MPHHLSAQDKIALIKRASLGESISQICDSVGVSRTIFYKWIKLYKSSSEDNINFTFLPKYRKGNDHWRKVSPSLERRILKMALRNPKWSPVQLSRHLPCSPSFIWTVLKRKGLGTIILREQHGLLYGERLINQLTPNDKLTLMKRYYAGESISNLARSFRISRTSFYKWRKIYQRGSDIANISNFKPSRPMGNKHWRHVLGSKELVLEIVMQYPNFSVHKIKDEIVRKFGKQLLSSYSIHTILRELGLTTFEHRIAYVASKSSISNGFKEVIDCESPVIPGFSFISPISPPLFDKVISYLKDHLHL